MKKLLFLATFSFLFVQLSKAVVLPSFDFSTEIIISETTAAAATQVEAVFGDGGDLSNLNLINSQQLSFTDALGATVLVDLQVQSDATIGNKLNVVFTTTANLNGLSAHSSQQLDFVHASIGATNTVSFIVIEIIGH